MNVRALPVPMTDAQAAAVLFDVGTAILELERDGLCTPAEADIMLARTLDFVAACVARHDALEARN